jgi:hypothetical protein
MLIWQNEKDRAKFRAFCKTQNLKVGDHDYESFELIFKTTPNITDDSLLKLGLHIIRTIKAS